VEKKDVKNVRRKRKNARMLPVWLAQGQPNIDGSKNCFKNKHGRDPKAYCLAVQKHLIGLSDVIMEG
jgi:hypothetical protein